MSTNIKLVAATGLRLTVMNFLKATRLLEPARALVHRIERLKKHQYYRRLIDLYRSPYSRLPEDYSEFEIREARADVALTEKRYELDRQTILTSVLSVLLAGCCSSGGETPKRLGLFLKNTLNARYAPESDTETIKRHVDCIRSTLSTLIGMENLGDWEALGEKIVATVDLSAINNAPNIKKYSIVKIDGIACFDADRALTIQAILDQVIDRNLAPRFYDYDYIDDIIGIIGGRYCGDKGCLLKEATSIIDTLCILTGLEGAGNWKDLPGNIRKFLNANDRYVPQRGDVTKHVWSVIPDMAEEFIRLKAETNTKRFLEINREYSSRQALRQGAWDNRELSLLRGYERNHHLLLRTLMELIRDGKLTKEDEVLLIGPRHIDEVLFFRNQLGLTKTIGLDLFDSGDNLILAGDMHDMSFKSKRFKLVFCAGTLSYSYNARQAVAEMARVLKQPGYILLIDAAGRNAGPDALGRSDVVSIQTLIGLFYSYHYEVIAKDPGRSLAPNHYVNEPCIVLCLHDRHEGFHKLRRNTDITRFLSPQ